jgi:hypothetical protein
MCVLCRVSCVVCLVSCVLCQIRNEMITRRTEELQQVQSDLQTTAVPRPNAYLPEDIALPRPYGGMAPFKPSEPGSSMRHIVKPQPREIEI